MSERVNVVECVLILDWVKAKGRREKVVKELVRRGASMRDALYASGMSLTRRPHRPMPATEWDQYAVLACWMIDEMLMYIVPIAISCFVDEDEDA